MSLDRFHYLIVFIYIEGFKEAAEKFRMESGIEPSVDLDSLDERIKIREMVLKGQIQEAIALINSLHPELLDTNRYLYFHLQVKQINYSFDDSNCVDHLFNTPLFADTVSVYCI